MYQRKVGSPVQTSGGPPGGPDLGGPRSKNAATFSEKNSPFPDGRPIFFPHVTWQFFRGSGRVTRVAKATPGRRPLPAREGAADRGRKPASARLRFKPFSV